MSEHRFNLSLTALRQAYRRGDFTPRSLMAQLRERAAQLNPEFHLFITLLDAAGQEPYLAALDGAAPDSLPLYGVPFAIKDNIDLAAVPTTAACPEFAHVPDQSATVVQRLIALGAVPMGKTNLDQFATGLNGTRSPYGACRNSVLADYPSGGSSSGSSLAVALGVASFSLGTDTAGSGRVPAALNNLIGLKPTRGIVSTRGLTPACRSLDCISFFTTSAEEASQLLQLAAGFDPGDSYSRRNPGWNAGSAFGTPRPFRFGVPKESALEWFGCTESPQLFAAARKRLEAIGGVAAEIDFQPFLDAAKVLYDGPWVAERFAAVGDFVTQHPSTLDPSVAKIVGTGDRYSALDLFRGQYQLQALKQHCDALMDAVDCVLMPTIPRACTLEELRAEPILRNSELGYYTNFVNLLDYTAVAVPTAFQANGLPWGVTLLGRAFTDQYLLSLAQAIQRSSALPLVNGEPQGLAAPTAAAQNDRARVVVCGAHLDGLALNWQLRHRGGRLLEATLSAPCYRLYALAGGPPFRPGMIRDASGRAIEVEVWELPQEELGSFLTGIAAPLGLGKLQLQDGRWETGFICESHGVEGASDITEFGGWRAYLASL